MTGDKLRGLLLQAVKRQMPNEKFGILFSGGVDSSMLAYSCKRLGREPVLYTTIFADPRLSPAEDYKYSKQAALALGLELKVTALNLKKTEKELPAVVRAIGRTNPIDVGIALTWWPSCKQAKEDGLSILMTGLGSDGLFAGHKHLQEGDVAKNCIEGIKSVFTRGVPRGQAVCDAFGLELLSPYLDEEFIEYALSIPGDEKVKDGQDKWVLRKAAEDCLPKEIAWRKTRSAQYGSRADNAIERLAKVKKMKKTEYISSIEDAKGMRVGVLFSSGKDSILAAHLAEKQGYELACLITLISENKFSYMFHTPCVDVAPLQAQAMELPIVLQKTKGEKEKELEDLEIALRNAMDKYRIEGVVAGALFSTYQTERVTKVCEKLGLKAVLPLWRMPQDSELNLVLHMGYEVIFSSVAAEGLDSSLVGKKIDKKTVEFLSSIKGMNTAGEGGEFETLVLDGPLFKKRVELVDWEVEEYSDGARLIVKKAVLGNQQATQTQ